MGGLASYRAPARKAYCGWTQGPHSGAHESGGDARTPFGWIIGGLYRKWCACRWDRTLWVSQVRAATGLAIWRSITTPPYSPNALFPAAQRDVIYHRSRRIPAFPHLL